MQIAGITAEYNPLHNGHLLQLQQTRRLLGDDCGIICVMSGNYVQRGDFALLRKHVRAEAAVRSGADLILELPLPWATASAEAFADGAVQTLLATGLVTHLSFGSECGDADALMRLAAAVQGDAFETALRRELEAGDSFAAARQRAAAALLSPADAALLASPNDILGTEYCKSLLRHGSSVTPIAIPRTGPGHDTSTASGDMASASAIRQLLRDGGQALELMAPAMQELYAAEEAAGRAPIFADACQRAVLAQLRRMSREDFAALDSGREGLGNRLYAAVQEAASVSEVLELAKAKRYPHARLRRMLLWAYLGLTPADVPAAPPYLRVLAANETGRALLKEMRKTASVPVLTKPADARALSPEAQRLFALEAQATDLYTLAYPVPTAPGDEWRIGPVIV